MASGGSEEGATISRKIGVFSAGLQYEDLPPTLIEFLKGHIIDTIGVSLAATKFDFAGRAIAGLSHFGECGENTVIGMSDKLQLKDAVLANGVLAHGLDYDDTHPGGPVHPSASVLPCVLGVAERLNCSGRELVVSYALGVEMATRIGIAANGTMHKRGFHTTGVVGHLACAIAAAKVMGLGDKAIAHAQGLAGSMASAIAQHRFDGAWNKRIHSGWAAVGGVTAASLAQGGFVGTSQVYEGDDGIFRTHAGEHHEDVQYDVLTAGLGEVWHSLDVAIKPYPICHILHACVDATLALKRSHDIHPDQIANVKVLLHPDTYHYVCEDPDVRRRPVSDYMAKFSAYYTVAAALVRGRCGFAELKDAVIRDPAILALAQRVTYSPDPHSRFPQYFSGGVEIELSNGKRFSRHEPVNRGAGNRRLTREEIIEKYMENAEFGNTPEKASERLNALLHIEHNSARNLASVLSG